jgi:D-alanine-D-alanine ligase
MGFNHTGADEYGWSIAQDKDNTKRHLVAQGIPTPRWLRVRDGKLTDWNHFPAIIKATMEHGSEALTAANVVTNPRALQTRVAELCAAGMNDLIVSEYIAGRELSVAVWGDGMLQVLPPVEIDFSDLPFETPHVRSAAAKWDEASQEYNAIRLVCPAHLTPLQRERAERQAQVAFWACGLRDYGRIDMRMFGDDLYVIDVNANPDITAGSSFILAAQVAGYDYATTLDHIIQFAYARQTRKHNAPTLWAHITDSAE